MNPKSWNFAQRTTSAPRGYRVLLGQVPPPTWYGGPKNEVQGSLQPECSIFSEQISKKLLRLRCCRRLGLCSGFGLFRRLGFYCGPGFSAGWGFLAGMDFAVDMDFAAGMDFAACWGCAVGRASTTRGNWVLKMYRMILGTHASIWYFCPHINFFKPIISPVSSMAMSLFSCYGFFSWVHRVETISNSRSSQRSDWACREIKLATHHLRPSGLLI